ncbi:glycohydrolase toxin TNT-related protein [Kutzneria sp. NPDC051319]|uniref:glycohydrolase toxin TNT-related protein n=1 Tax=Kutzneria sp. NPDC051319 TaxID=3155047 RepID=UPI003419EFA4
MGITLPADLAEIAGQVGVQWPQADETAMRAAAQAWRTAATKLTTLAKDADRTASDAFGAMSGQAADAADDFWGKFVHGENAKFTQAVKGCLAAADRLEQAAQKIGAAKVDIVRKLTAVSQHAGAANAAPGDVSKAGLNTLLSGAGADINGILGTLTSDVNPAVLAAPVVSADAPAALTGKDKTVGPDGGLLGLSAGLPDVDSITPGVQVDPSQVQYDPSTGHYVDKTTGNVIDPKTGLPMLPGSADDSPTGQFPIKTGQFPVNTGPAGAPPPDNSAAPTGPVPRHVIDAATPAPNYGGGYSPPPVYSDPTPTGPVHVPPPHTPQGTTVQSAAAPVYSPPPVPEAPAYQPPSTGGGGGYWTPPAADNSPSIGSGPAQSAPPPGMPVTRGTVPPAFGQPGVPGAPGQPAVIQPGAPGGAVPGGPVAGGPAAGGSVAGGAGGAAGGVVAGQPGAGQSGAGAGYAQQPGNAAGAAAVVNTTRRPGDVSGVYIDDHRAAAAAVIKPVVRKPTVAPGLFLVYMFPIGHMPTPSSRPARQLPPPAAEVDYAAGLRFPPHDHPDSGLIQALGSTRADAPEPRDGDELAEGYDPLGGENERDWDRRFLVRAGAEDRRAEYAWPPGELFPEGGCDAGEAVVLEPGVVIDRFGTPEGRVFGAEGTPFTQRSLPPEHLDAGYRRYRVLAPLPIWQTISAAWFGQTGGGVRYRSVYPAADLVALGFLEAVA